MSRAKKIGSATLALIVLAAALVTLAQTAEKPPTELYVRTSPPGATIIVDGKQQGTSPALFEVEPGEHDVAVQLPGHEPKMRKVTVRDGRIRRVILELQKRPEGRDAKLEPAGAETPWGKAVEGVQCRLRPDKGVWKPGEVPTFKAEIRNRGTRSLRVAASQEGSTLVLDGKTYHWPGFQFVETVPLHPGSGYDVRISLIDTWFGGRPAPLAPGEHKLSVRFQCLGVGTQSDKLVALVESNTVEFEIRADGTPAQPYYREKAQAVETEARRTVEWFLAAAIGGRNEEAIRMTDPASAVGRQLEDIRNMGGAAAMKVARVSVKDNTALAVTTQVKDDRDRERVLVIRLTKSRGQWVVQDIDFISPAEARSEFDAIGNPVGNETPPAESAAASGASGEATLSPFTVQAKLTDDDIDGGIALDLDSGRTVNLPAGLDSGSHRQLGNWLYEHHLEVVVKFEGNRCCILGRDVVLKALDADRVNDLTVADLRYAIASGGKHSDRGLEAGLLPHGFLQIRLEEMERFPVTFAFQTAAGNLGLLQIVQRVEAPRVLQFRWRIVRIQRGTE